MNTAVTKLTLEVAILITLIRNNFRKFVCRLTLSPRLEDLSAVLTAFIPWVRKDAVLFLNIFDI